MFVLLFVFFSLQCAPSRPPVQASGTRCMHSSCSKTPPPAPTCPYQPINQSINSPIKTMRTKKSIDQLANHTTGQPINQLTNHFNRPIDQPANPLTYQPTRTMTQVPSSPFHYRPPPSPLPPPSPSESTKVTPMFPHDSLGRLPLGASSSAPQA